MGTQLIRDTLNPESINDSAEQGLSIRCPHCDRSIVLSDDATVNRIHCPFCGGQFQLADDPEIPERRRTIGHFQLIEEIGRGAFGSVWKATDVDLNRSVTVKIPRLNQ
jgi:serine/threonine protein kinase